MLTDSYNDMMLMLKAHDDNQQAFIMNASHELKTPLTVISSYAKMLERFGKTREDLLDEGITAISEETTRMKYLTEQFLSFTKVTHSDTSADKEHIPVVQLVKSVAARLEKVFKRNISVISDDTNPHVYVYPDALEQLLRIFLTMHINIVKKILMSRLKKTLEKLLLQYRTMELVFQMMSWMIFLRGFIVSIRQELVRAGVPA